VSEGQRDPVVPDLVGQPERTADIVLAQDQIQIANRAEIGTARYPAGVVVAQDPAAQDRSARVSLLVNRGEGGVTFVMPDVIGTLGLRTVDILRRRGFRVSVTAEVPYPGLPPGVIVRQTPQAGFQIGYGDPVQLEISR
jgi:beta-lactam-binding protein with PASTA domain